jgi:outer membrane protein assembly factor BamB
MRPRAAIRAGSSSKAAAVLNEEIGREEGTSPVPALTAHGSRMPGKVVTVVKRRLLAASILLLTATCTLVVAARRPTDDAMRAMAAEIIDATGVKGGLIVHLGCGDGQLTAALRANGRYLVHGLDASAANVRRARATIRSLDQYGSVSVEQWNGPRLPYAENLVNLLVAEDMGEVSMDEVMRVLAPNGVAYVKERGEWAKRVKPWPDDIDEWTHHVHGADGNAVAHDRVVGPPRHYQWVAGPTWLRSHDTDSSISAVVTAGGRIFYVIDQAPISLPGDHPLPDKWFLVARDAFNGVFLWQVPIESWGWREWKDTWFTDRPDNLPVNLPKRLVAAGERVYVTLGYHAPVSELDAATGEALQTYEGTEDTREILNHNGRLILSVYRDGKLKVMAIDASSGDVVWETPASLAGSSREYFPEWRRKGEGGGPKVDPALNPATDGEVVCLLDGQEVACLDFATGGELWRTKVEEKEPAAWVGTMVLADGVVLHANPTELIALSAKTGERLWSQPKRELGWLWFQWKDVFAIDGLVWTWSEECDQREFETATQKYRARWPLYVNGYDILTGEVKRQVSTGNIYIAPHHHRCYRNKATDRFILSSRRGTEFVDLEGGKHTVHNWVRGTCHLGMMPANGLQYAPSHPCVCYIQEKLNGFTALAPEIPEQYRRDGSEDGPRLERGPAYGEPQTRNPEPETAVTWATYRHDPMRSGSTPAVMPERLGPGWDVAVGDRVSPPTVVGDGVFVSSIDEHTVTALSATDGRRLWEFTAGGRVDTPPTWHRGLVLFGSADGWVYCLRASDGELVWRFRAGPEDRRIGAFGQLESAWPVHGSVLVQGGLAYFAAGRSSHLDGGIFLYAVELATGKLAHETLVEGPRMDPDNFTDNISQPQGALPDVLQSDGERIYMRHLGFDAELGRQAPDPSRITATGGLLDDSYFKRAPWRFSRGPNWGRLIVHDDRTVYLVRMFETLKCLEPSNFFTPASQGYLLAAGPRNVSSAIKVANSDSLNPVGKPLTVEAWIKAEKPDGAIAARGGVNHGYALVLKGGKPEFTIRVSDVAYSVTAGEAVTGQWTHVAGVLTEDKQLQVYINGALAASEKVIGPLVASPGQPMEVGADLSTGAGEYESPFGFTGAIDEVRLYHRALSEAELQQHTAQPGQAPADEAGLALYFSFDKGDAADESGNGNDGVLESVESVDGKAGKAMSFASGGGAEWSVHVPIRVQAVVAASTAGAGGLIFAAGPPDIVPPDDPLGAFEGRKGGLLWVFAADDGDKVAEYELDSPPVFNGMAAAGGRLFIATHDGRVVCMRGA